MLCCADVSFAHVVQTYVHLSLVQSVNTNSVYILIPAENMSFLVYHYNGISSLSVSNQPYKCTTSCPCLASACCFFFWHVRILASHPASRQVSALGLFSFFCFPPSMASAVIDEAMRSYGGKEWRFESLPVPRCEVKMPGDMDAPITVEDFLSCCRQPSGVKTTVMILDVQLAVSDCGSPGDVALALKEQRVASLPVALHFAESPPADSKVGGIVMDKGNGQLDVIKYVTFKDKVSTREATKLIAGSAYVPFPRPGPWSVKKAFQSLLDRLPGHHVHWSTVTKWEAQSKSGSSSASTWAPDTESLLQGVSFINDNAPEIDANNEQHTWILMSIKEDSNSPIAGYKKMLCLDGEGPSHLTTFDIKRPMSMKESSWMIPTVRTSPWLT